MINNFAARIIVISVLSLFIDIGLFAQPQRKAVMGMQGKPVANGIAVDTVYAGTTFANLSIKKGDVLESVNDKPTLTIEVYNSIVAQIRNGDEVKMKYLRGNKELSAVSKAVVKPMEVSTIADIEYDWVKFRNGYLRAIARKPKGKENVPCILLIPGYGCGSIESFSNSYNGKIMNEWLKNGYGVVTIEKSGMGDSEGCEPCAEVDLATDIESFDDGYRYMEQLPWVDTTKLFIWGHSMGGSIALFRPWSEFLLEMHRVQKPLLDSLSYQQTENFVRQIQKIYYEFFVLKKTPKQLHDNPEYKALLESELEYKEGSNNMWGRHWRFWQQLDSINLAESWRQVNCPVLILHGGADYEQCSLVEPLMIKETVNSSHAGYATQITIPDLDHFMMKSADWKEAAKNFKEQQYAKGNFNYRIAEETVKWLNMHL